MNSINQNIIAYRGLLDDSGCSLSGRVLGRPLLLDPGEHDTWWDNLVNAYRRFDSERIPGVRVVASFRGQQAEAVSDQDGYYNIRLPVAQPAGTILWDTAQVSCDGKEPVFLQPVLCVPRTARFGVISDIDDTVLESNITHWQTAVKLTFLHNARTRKPLEGVAKLYKAFQNGRDGHGPNPVFYVSASPWNLYDLLEDFIDLNGVPQGPILLRDVDFERASLSMDAGTRGKLDSMHGLIDRYPGLQWVLMGDSGQIDAELYVDTVRKYPGRILAVYIRDVDPVLDSPRDKFVDTQLKRIAGTGVPMLRVTDSNAIAAHARELGLIEAEEIAEVARDVKRDKSLPETKVAAAP